ncbi:MAG: cation diffusion facilitator family transporter [Alphaproteobacteria bacterium]|nr:cation diffusion facilitator family transporter [Alphaproteobacteria bacterium]
MRQATYAAVAVALTLIAVKTFAWLATGSVTVLSSLVDSLLDAAASLVNLVAVRQALEPADAEHRFGHGKAEPLAALAQSAFIGGSAVLILLEAVSRLIEPKPIDNVAIGIGVMVFSVIVTFALLRFQAYVVRRSGSVAIRADSLHYAGDALMNGSVITSLVLSAWLGISWLDPLFGAGIAAYLVKTAIGIGRQALDMLMDRELPDGDRHRIEEIVRGHPEVLAVHDLRTRGSGLKIFIQLHMVLPAELSLSRAHVISDAVEAKLLEAFPGAEILIHQDPTDAAEPEMTR